jgi:phosphopantothenoylcysteine decarboxylase/phosphopantothenate--cysteine ligase
VRALSSPPVEAVEFFVMSTALRDKTIVVGVTGGIAAYKAAELVRLLVGKGAKVRVMMTPNAARFITPLTLQTLSGNSVADDTFSLTQESDIGHIRLAELADALAVAPATADFIARAAAGMADDIVTTVMLAARCPVVIAPAMNVHMYANPAVVENIARLRARNLTVIEPAEGELACGYEGKGRLPEPALIVDELERILTRHDLAGERILVTAGPTREAIDPVRFISNHSSGKMGFAIARAAWRRGAMVRLVTGPSALPTPTGVERINTVSATELLGATSRNFPWCSVLVMAAAVADFRPSSPAAEKLKKSESGMSLELEPIPDMLPRLSGRKAGRIIIGFAAETSDLERNARDKLKRKKLDIIVANDVTRADAGFNVDTNAVTIIGADGRLESHPSLSKDVVADLILDRLVALRASRGRQPSNRVAR